MEQRRWVSSIPPASVARTIKELKKLPYITDIRLVGSYGKKKLPKDIDLVLVLAIPSKRFTEVKAHFTTELVKVFKEIEYFMAYDIFLLTSDKRAYEWWKRSKEWVRIPRETLTKELLDACQLSETHQGKLETTRTPLYKRSTTRRKPKSRRKQTKTTYQPTIGTTM